MNKHPARSTIEPTPDRKTLGLRLRNAREYVGMKQEGRCTSSFDPS